MRNRAATANAPSNNLTFTALATIVLFHRGQAPSALNFKQRGVP
jgi:hypothetical protein